MKKAGKLFINLEKKNKHIKEELNEDKYTEGQIKYIKKQISISDSEPINLQILKNFINDGFKRDNYRPTLWKLFLNYLPVNKFKIEFFLSRRRELYKLFLETNHQLKQEKTIIGDLNRTFLFPIRGKYQNDMFCDFLDRKVGDRSMKKFTDEYFLEKPNFEKGFQERDILLEIQSSRNLKYNLKHKKLSHLNNPFPMKKFRNNNKDYLIELTYNETHREVINRLLQIHNQLNPAVGYIQGLHLLIIPIYYVLVTSENILDYFHAETDTFFLFVNLIAEISECLVKNNPNGLIDKCVSIPELIKTLDFDYFVYLKFHKIFDTKIYLKWIICLFGTEYKILELINLWDYLLSDSNRYELVYFATISVLLYFKDEIQTLKSEDILIFLQSDLSKLSVEELIKLSKESRKRYYEKTNKNF